MCGIFGAVITSGVIDKDQVIAGTVALKHRGPDATGFWFSPAGQVGLGHTRLAIVGPSDGIQPIPNEAGDIVAIVNGEFYGFQELRKELCHRGHRFITKSDSEIIVHLYEEYGDACLHKLRGEFAFALWDGRMERMLVGRDHFGAKPLFYAEHQNAWFFSSEIKGLLRIGISRELDYEEIFDELHFLGQNNRTLFKKVHQIPPSCFGSIRNGVLRITSYWDLDYPVSAARDMRCQDELVEEFIHTLESAVSERLIADVPIDCYLSGGLDSSSLLAIAAPRIGQVMRAFHVSFPEAGYDESIVARRVAAHVKATFVQISVSEREIAEHFRSAVLSGEALAWNGHAIARYIQSRAVHKSGCRVALSGDGADELLAGYPSARQQLASCDHPDCAQRAHSEPTARALSSVAKILGFVPVWMERLIAERQCVDLFLSADFVSAYSISDTLERFFGQFDLGAQASGRDSLQASLYLWTRSILPNYTLAADRLDMASSVEVRLPFLDWRLFDVAKKLPNDMLIRGGREKYVLREAVKRLLPPWVCERPKQSFTAPPWLNNRDGPMCRLMRDLLSNSQGQGTQIEDRSPIAMVLDPTGNVPEWAESQVEPILMMLGCLAVVNAQSRQ